MTYSVHSIFKTIQGEGAYTGRVAVFCRFAGCNLWSGREEDRSKAVCQWCDTEFVGGSKYETANQLADAIALEWGSDDWDRRMAVLTGGEPALQYDMALRMSLKARGFFIAIETNGSIKLKAPVDWKCVSPKAGTKIVEGSASELKFVFPQEITPEDAAKMVRAEYYSIQPMDGPRKQENTADAIEYVLEHPSWRLGTQMHKFIGVA